MEIQRDPRGGPHDGPTALEKRPKKTGVAEVRSYPSRSRAPEVPPSSHDRLLMEKNPIIRRPPMRQNSRLSQIREAHTGPVKPCVLETQCDDRKNDRRRRGPVFCGRCGSLGVTTEQTHGVFSFTLRFKLSIRQNPNNSSPNFSAPFPLKREEANPQNPEPAGLILLLPPTPGLCAEVGWSRPRWVFRRNNATQVPCRSAEAKATLRHPT